jgi:cytochrome c oxidase subunit 4
MSSAEHRPHPTPGQYWMIAAFLAGVTGVEVAMYYIDQQLELGFFNVAVLLVLSAVKFLVVVGWFMHVRFEKPMISRFFTAGFFLACGLYLVVLSSMGIVAIRGG